MHVRIAWEIYHHQQKTPGSDGKTAPLPTVSTAPPTSAPSFLKPTHPPPPPDPMRPLNSLFSLPPRPHELSLSSSLLSAAVGQTPTPRPPSLDPLSLHHTSSAGLFGSASPYSRPPLGFPSYSPLSGLSHPSPTPGLLPGLSPAARDPLLPGLGFSDPWLRPSPSALRPPSLYPPLVTPTSHSLASSSGWGGLKAEAERDRTSEEDKRRYEEKRHESKSQERPRHEERDRDRHRDSNHKQDSHRNGEYDHRRSWDQQHNKGHKREHSKSPVGHPHKHSKTDSSYHGDKDVKVKEERKEEKRDHKVIEHKPSMSSSSSLSSLSSPLTAANPPPLGGMVSPLERARLMGMFGLPSTHTSMGPPLGPMDHMDPLKSMWGLFPHADPFKSLHEFPARPDLLEREHLFQRYNILNSSGGGAPLTDKLAKENALDRDKDKHLLPPSLRPPIPPPPPVDPLAHAALGAPPPFPTGLHAPPLPPLGRDPLLRPPHSLPLPPAPPSSLFAPNPYLNSLHSLSNSLSASPSVITARSRPTMSTSTTSSAANHSSTSSSKSSPSPPPSGHKSASNSTLAANSLPGSSNHSTASNSPTGSAKISVNTLVENSIESVKELSRSPPQAVTNGQKVVDEPR